MPYYYGNDGGGGLCGIAYHICCCLFCLVCLGPILIIIGVVVLFTLTVNGRANEIVAFNNAVTAWNNTYRPEFVASPGFSIGSPFNVTLAQDLNADALMDTGTDYLTYQPLKFDSLNVAMPSIIYSPQTTNYQINFPLLDNNGTSLATNVVIFKTASLSYTQLGTTCSTTNYNNNNNRPCQFVCADYLGSWDQFALRCTVAAVVTQLCVKVSLVGQQWQLDSKYGGVGCQPTNAQYPNLHPPNFPYDGLTTQPIEKYKLVVVPANGFAVNIPNVNVIVRHTQDPFVVAGYITGGSYNFGATTGQKLTTGLILIIVGGVFTLPAIIAVVLVIVCVRNRNRNY